MKNYDPQNHTPLSSIHKNYFCETFTLTLSILHHQILVLHQKLTVILQSKYHSAGYARVPTADFVRASRSTERVSSVDREVLTPSNGGSSPPHVSTVIYEDSICVRAISNNHSLEGAGNHLCVIINGR